ncbi:MAG: bestrophin family protein [Xanthobacter sp.]
MILRERPDLLHLFIIFRSSVLRRIFPQVMTIMVLSTVIVLAHTWHPGLVPTFSGAPFALLGIALSVFLGFSNNACYERWWEARKAWGFINVAGRNLGRRTLLLEARGPRAIAARQRIVKLLIAFGHVLVVHLRPSASPLHVNRCVPTDLKSGMTLCRNQPEFLLRAIGTELAELRNEGLISDIELQLLDESPSLLAEALTTCERVQTTPVPFGYTLLLHRTAYMFCFLLPFGFADILGWVTPLATALVAYTFFGLDGLASELEEPFGTLPNDLPIQALATNLEIGLLEALGETHLPAPPEPVNHILY